VLATTSGEQPVPVVNNTYTVLTPDLPKALSWTDRDGLAHTHAFINPDVEPKRPS
jgi:hypothetical protein